MKQIIVVRKELNMEIGKTAVQVAHASMKATVLHMDDPRVKEWLGGLFTKIALVVDTEAELHELYDKAKAAGLIAEYIIDQGLTVFNNVPTLTCIAIGPDTHENLKPITGKLKKL